MVGHPIAPQTSAVMRRLLEDVVTLGGGKNAFIPGYHVGGKTGTAQVYVDGVDTAEALETAQDAIDSDLF